MYTRILVPIDGSSTSECALAEAARLAGFCGARIEVLHVIEGVGTGFEPPAIYYRDVLPSFERQGEQLLKAAADALRAKGLTVETLLQTSRGERVSQIIVDRARSGGADLIVLGTHGRRGFGRMMMGSDAEQVARTSPVPVMLVRSKSEADEARADGRQRDS